MSAADIVAAGDHGDHHRTPPQEATTPLGGIQEDGEGEGHGEKKREENVSDTEQRFKTHTSLKTRFENTRNL